MSRFLSPLFPLSVLLRVPALPFRYVFTLPAALSPFPMSVLRCGHRLAYLERGEVSVRGGVLVVSHMVRVRDQGAAVETRQDHP